MDGDTVKILITKQQLLDASSMREKELFAGGWPEHRKKLNLCEVIRLARELGVGWLTIQYYIWRYDKDEWKKATAKAGTMRGKDIIDAYLEDNE